MIGPCVYAGVCVIGLYVWVVRQGHKTRNLGDAGSGSGPGFGGTCG